MEEKGKISKLAADKLDALCRSLIKTAESLTVQIAEFNINILSELQLLTVGPQLRGSMNNEYGQIATQKTFSIIKDFVKDYILSSCRRQEGIQSFWQLALQNIRQECCREIGKNECRVRSKVWY